MRSWSTADKIKEIDCLGTARQPRENKDTVCTAFAAWMGTVNLGLSHSREFHLILVWSRDAAWAVCVQTRACCEIVFVPAGKLLVLKKA